MEFCFDKYTGKQSNMSVIRIILGSDKNKQDINVKLKWRQLSYKMIQFQNPHLKTVSLV